MHSFISNQPPEISASPDVLEIHPDKSIGIEEIRQVIIFLSKKPIQSAKNTVIIHQAHLLTLPAQNAFLKTLEEPPANSEIYLITDYQDQLLPTIQSRCQNMSYMSHTTHMTYSPVNSDLFQRLLTSGVGDRLKILDAAKFDRQTALEFFNDCEKIIHHNISRIDVGAGSARPQLYDLILKSKTYLKSNVNLKLILDNFAISLSS